MAMSSTASGAAKLCYSVSHLRHSKPAPKKAIGTIKFVIENPGNLSRTTARRSFPIRALDPQRQADEEKEYPTDSMSSLPFPPQEDIGYLWKLVAGSVAGAAAIKYGSTVFPEITRPNILQALIMIWSPIIVAVLILIKRSWPKTRS